ncbi:hypothetical protein T12_2826 [Trichinella patagoniensis]|uniref:Uncharacterized protein n=1 Tax=Trichinella patagoniensis TaxID=990121 RepID=A0A0V0YV75_9BILA|nr:hypothetical protein T12_2826 [Trichinella patagoniensis]
MFPAYYVFSLSTSVGMVDFRTNFHRLILLVVELAILFCN